MKPQERYCKVWSNLINQDGACVMFSVLSLFRNLVTYLAIVIPPSWLGISNLPLQLESSSFKFNVFEMLGHSKSN
jgi:hypothetical protein